MGGTFSASLATDGPNDMIRNLLICGLLAGVVGSGLAIAFAEVVGEPAVDKAITLERSRAGLGATKQDPPMVSRGLQQAVGLPVATLLYGSAVGGLFALAFAFVYGRVGRVSPAGTAMWLAAAAFVVVFLVPFLKYSSNPPGVGLPGTIGLRSALYATMVAISLLAAVGAVRIRHLVAMRIASARATTVAIASYVAIVVIAGLVLPTVQEVPPDFPATMLWEFRRSAVGMQLILWTGIGITFAILAQRVMARSGARAPGAAAGN